jgi:proteasome-associated ATPase
MTEPVTDQTRSLNIRIDELAESNQRLTTTLREARDQIVGLKEEVDRLSAPPNGYAIFVGTADEDLVDVSINGRKMRVAISPDVDRALLLPGQEVILNESMNVVVAGRFDDHGEIVIFQELIDDGKRAIITGRSDEERVIHLAAPLAGITLRNGDSLLADMKSGYAFERIAKSEVEDLILEEVPDINYEDIGGLGPQIEMIRDAVELPFLHPELFHEYELKPPKGILLYGPPGCSKTLMAKAIASSANLNFFVVKGPEV